ncbi:hypothetical protein RKD22_001663 [Streptomyces pristinaespiralis]
MRKHCVQSVRRGGPVRAGNAVRAAAEGAIGSEGDFPIPEDDAESGAQ